MEPRVLKLVAPVAATPDEVIRAARFIQDASNASADGPASGEITLKINNYTMQVTASARDAVANASLSRLELFVEHPKKAALSDAGRKVLSLLNGTLRRMGPGVRIQGEREITLDDEYWGELDSALGESPQVLKFVERTTIDGIVTGVRSTKGRCLVQLRTRSGNHEFEAGGNARSRALQLFEQQVYAMVEFENSGSNRKGIRLLELNAMAPQGDILAQFATARAKLAAQGVRVIPSELSMPRSKS